MALHCSLATHAAQERIHPHYALQSSFITVPLLIASRPLEAVHGRSFHYNLALIFGCFQDYHIVVFLAANADLGGVSKEGVFWYRKYSHRNERYVKSSVHYMASKGIQQAY